MTNVCACTLQSKSPRPSTSDKVVTSGRRWRQEGFGATGEAYLVGSDDLARSGPRAFYEKPQSVRCRSQAQLKHRSEDRRHPALGRS
jgi:hypothetical protein